MRFALLLLFIPTLAAAAADEVTARPATPGTDVDDAVGKVTRADDECHPKCTTKAVKSLALPGGAKLSLRQTTNSGFQGKGYVVVVENASGVWAWNGDGLDDNVWLLDNDSGMGKTADERIEKLTIERKDGLVWIRFRIEFTLTYFQTHRTTTRHYDSLVACKVDGPTPACASVIGSRWTATTATFTKTTVSLRDAKDGGGSERSTVELRF